MTNFAALLLALTGSISARVLTTLGIGVISYASLSTLAAKVKALVLQSYNALDVDVLGFFNLMGVGEAIQILVAAVITKAAMKAVKHLGILLNS